MISRSDDQVQFDGFDLSTSPAKAYLRIYSSHRVPRLPGDGCGCERKRLEDMWVLVLCERHSKEPGIFQWVLP